ncbi:MAG: TetR/AcrR family transcriptional regulator [Myxococcota bacterium]|nr:TetR/AcrR family transcriptional regulator [Myxococcota bacterium]
MAHHLIPSPPPRRAQRRSRETRERLVAAALHEFAEKGFGGASTRAIASRAGVAQSAVPYHFQTKEALWQAAADHLFGLLGEQFRARVVGLEGVDQRTRARLLLRDFVLFAAAHPELHRFMLQEGTGPSERLAWLVETHLRPTFDFLLGQLADLETAGGRPPGRPEHLHYMMIGAASTPYALAPEFELLTGEDPFSKAAVDAHVEAVLALFFPESTGDAR